MSKKLTHEILADVKRLGETLGVKLPTCNDYRKWKEAKFTYDQLCDVFGNWTKFVLVSGLKEPIEFLDEGTGPVVGFIDIETAPMEVYVYQPWQQDIREPQVIKDWSILSWAGKLLGGEIIYHDQKDEKDVRDETEILTKLWHFLDSIDILITQNGKKFDIPKINARMIHLKVMDRKPYSSFKHVDTKLIAKRHFGFTYNSLKYLCKFLGVEHQKLEHEKFPGMELQKACLASNAEAWAVMQEYNKQDILALEDCWTVMRAWDSSINFNLYTGTKFSVCRQPGCGGEYQKNGFYWTSAGKFQRFRCEKCGSEARGRENLLSKGKKEALKLGTPR